MRKAFAAVAIAALVGVGCSGWNDERGRGDAPVGNRDDTEADIVNMPDQFQNIAVKCYGPNGIYTTTREAAPVVIKDDANCEGVSAGDAGEPK